MRVAYISDTHGNLTAFERVLADIDTRGIETIVHLGDVAGKGPRGSDCCALARERCDVVVRGNWDVFLLREPDDQTSESVRWWHSELGEANLKWFASLPYCVDIRYGDTLVRGYHASADSAFHRIYPTVGGTEWDDMFATTEATGPGPNADVVVYGDIHYAWERTQNDRTVLNCGSVGNPLDFTTASYLVVEDGNPGHLGWELVRLEYDIEAELAAARAVEMPTYDAWAQELRTAIYAR